MTVTLPGPTLGVVGGGQLGRMLAEAAASLGVEVLVLDPTPDCPASALTRDQLVADFDDESAVRELADRTDALTYEIELADADLLDAVERDTGIPVHPDPETLRLTQDKLLEAQFLADAGIPVAPFRRVDDAADLRAAVDAFDGVMLKARTGGYDGRGNVPVSPGDDPVTALEEVGADEGGAVAEALVDFERELAVMGARSEGETATFDVTETIHEDEILREMVAPARTDPETLARAHDVAADVLDLLSGRGIFGIELFESSDGEILVNELAPRPHNSGHWTIEGAVTSQFEQHARAVFGWPLGSTRRRETSVTANVLGTGTTSRPASLAVDDVLAADAAHFHWYGKREVRPLRKMGHLTVTGDDTETLLATARTLRDGLVFE